MNPQIQAIIEKIDQMRDQENPYWNISYDTGIFLNTLVRTRNAKQILEVGTSIGYSALFLADAAMSNQGHVYTIESHNYRFTEAAKHFQQAGVETYITQIKGHAPEIFSFLSGPFDIVFLDATKGEHLSYIQEIESRLSEHALVITDNIISHKKELTEFIAYMDNHKHFQNSIIDIGTGLMLSVHIPS